MTISQSDEPITIETCHNSFFQGESGDKLLHLVLGEIQKCGGRAKMGYYITHHEAPDWFKTNTRHHFMWIVDRMSYNKIKTIINPAETYERKNGSKVSYWTEEEVENLKAYWPLLRMDQLVEKFNRSKETIRVKARNSLTKEEYENRYYNKVKQGEKRESKKQRATQN